jgi:hypothetical protein
MLSDIETTEDLLGFSVHADLLKKVVTTPKNLPITVGLYGDWGGGKTSVLKILQEKLNEENDVVAIYFDGWSFESFDDAKMALISGIVEKLEKEGKFTSKFKFKDEAKSFFGKLKKSINWMRVLQFGVKTAAPIAMAALTGGTALIPLAVAQLLKTKEEVIDNLTPENITDAVSRFTKVEDDEKKYEAVREFRGDFEKLIKKSGAKSVVILIDDLDRCLPRHIIDNLEAIKLFLNVENTAFVIAADEFIVSNAIKTEYKDLIEAANKQGGEDSKKDNSIGNAYMEKFIQLPYKLPRLNWSEIETYVALLLCKSSLDEKAFKPIYEDFCKFSKENKFEKYGWANIDKFINNQVELKQTVAFMSKFSYMIGHSLKENPRLIKRFLNAYDIRSQLLEISDLNTVENKLALLKLMIIEQKFPKQFQQLYDWVAENGNVPKPLLSVEKYAEKQEGEIEYSEWNDKDLLELLKEKPLFSNVRLKELFWVSRDNLVDSMSGSSLISPKIKKLFNDCYKEKLSNKLNNYCESALTLNVEDLNDFYTLIDESIALNSKDTKGFNIYLNLIKLGAVSSYNRLIEIMGKINMEDVSMALTNEFKDLLKSHSDDTELIRLLKKNKKFTNLLK